MALRELSENEKSLWNQFIDSSPYSTILQYWQWGEVKRTEGWTPYRTVYESESEIITAMQILVKAAPGIGNYAYVPYGPIYRNFNDFKKHFPEILHQLKQFVLDKGCFVVELDPLIGELVEDSRESLSLTPYLDFSLKDLLLENGFKLSSRNFQPKHKLFYDLTQSEDELMGLMKKNTRYNVRYAEKNGVEVESTKMSDPEAGEKIEKFYKLLEETQERASGYPIRPKSTFLKLLEEFKEIDNLEMFTASYEGDVIAINISEFTSYWSSSFYGASNRLHPKMKASYLMRWKSVMKAKERGCKVYDFWGIVPNSNQHQGYSDNKMSFGGTRMDTYGLFALPLSSWKYAVWDKLLPLRGKF